MAFDNNQAESALPAGSNKPKRTSLDFLPKYFRTPANQKFLSATVDQMISEGTVGKVNAYIGRKETPAYTTMDRYLEEVTTDRQAYQFEPALVSKDTLGNVTFFKDYNDYINQLKYFSSSDINHSSANKEEFYAWNPHIDWDKFVNYREYYWLPTGPQAISILGQSTDIISTYTVTLSSEVDNIAYVFSPDGLTRNPTFKLYRGQTYNFEIDCDTRPIAFKTLRSLSADGLYSEGVILKNADGVVLPAGSYVRKGSITFTVPNNAPNVLYYVSQTDVDSSGYFTIYDITDSTVIDVELEILGKKTYTTSSSVNLSNGMKLSFVGQVTPAKYASGNWYVEGVGSAIRLVSDKDLYNPASYASLVDVEFDTENFDTQGFDVNDNYPATKDYIVINRSSNDQNPWSRHNRWFHRRVIETSAFVNNQPAVIDQDARAKRPIIEFEPNIQLWNNGRSAKDKVTVIDTFTTDVFSTIEGSYGYNVDSVDLVDGMRVLFTADTDTRVAGRIFKVKFITHLGERRITLLTEPDTEPQDGEIVLAVDGAVDKGSMYHYTDGVWTKSQTKTSVNQSPLFQVVDATGISYGDTTKYPGTTFVGTKLFSYEPGTTYDTELKFNIAYRNVGNFGDIVFNFNLHTDTHTYQSSTSSTSIIKPELGYLRINNSRTSFSHNNGWIIADKPSSQSVMQQYDIDQLRNMIPIDAYANSANLTDLAIKVYVNGTRKYNTDFTLVNIENTVYIQFFVDLNLNDVLLVKTVSAASKIKGFYEFPFNLENNPQNLSLSTFTLGEINNHVSSIADSIGSFVGTIPGTNSLRDFGNISSLGKKIVQHSAPLLPVAYHITNKRYNVISALKQSRVDYAKFKRNLIRRSTDYGYDGITRIHLDLLLADITRDFTKNDPYFLTDMIPFGANFVFDQLVIDNSITEYPVIFDFNLLTSTEKAVLVYVNEVLLVHGVDYIFTDTNFVKILTPIEVDDSLKIVQYEKTDGCFLPATPSKLGLYPKFEPQIFVDTTYQTPTKVIQGHDGSITVAFNDFRDDLLLEFERRIYNNIKSAYNIDIFDLYDFLPGYTRNTGLSTDDINSIIASDFLHWSTLISDDYTTHSFYNINNPKTFNYNEFGVADGSILPGFWRGIFKHIYDTDRPNTHPWEMIGFSIKPTWWNSVYGPAPYSSNNLILWSDLAQGLIKEPGKVLIKNDKFVRPNLLNMIPVDESGGLKPPTDLNIINGFTVSLTEGKFRFGDNAPIESAWRRSSEFPFSIITALTTLRPATVFASCFDRERQYRDDTGQLVYKVTDGSLRFNIANLVIPSTPDDNSRVHSAGLVNYIVDYIISRHSLSEVDIYKSEIANLEARMSSKLGGFTTKEKFKLILDSRNPLNTSNVFVPEENYDIILNTSSPVASYNYSAVIVEKQPGGFIINGYNKSAPMFKYFKSVATNFDPTTNVGGVSESFSTWDSNFYYAKNTVVNYDNTYFKVEVAHQSTSIFEVKYFTKLPKLPVTGGRNIILRSKFDTEVSTLHYGAELGNIQDVVDFLVGHEAYLISIGFKFENFNNTIRNITDFKTSSKEFAFWTTQQWAAGSVISLSPFAEELKFSQRYAVVDNIHDSFYEYSILKQDGTALSSLYTGNVRDGNLYTLRPKNTADGIYHATLNLVQKEHVLILDNITIFNDVIYDQVQGYRQERIKVIGYKTDDWQGDFDIPGFVYDQASLSFWKPWQDFNLGDTVKYKEFYYSANTNVVGSETFNFNQWNKLTARPQAKLIPNWDYRANQFADFYDLDTDSFDLDQQKFAQHLIGYQKRQYLENIINDEVSQYKFYQGFITEKGTSNSFSKLFDALSTSTSDSLEFYEEWAIRVGQYGANAGFDEVEYRLDEAQFLINPQPVELVNSINPNQNDFVYRILPSDVYLKSKNYTHAPFPTKKLNAYYVATAGYVNPNDVEIRLLNKTSIPTVDINTLNDGYYFWIAEDTNSWNIYRFTLFENLVRSIDIVADRVRITLNRLLDTDIKVGDYIGINNTLSVLEGMHAVTSVESDYFEIVKPKLFTEASILSLSLSLNLFKFISVRVESIEQANILGIPKKKPGDLLWVDGTDNNWAVWKYDKTYQLTSIENTTPNFGKILAVDKNNTVLAVSAQNSVMYYTRPSGKSPWAFKAEVIPVSTQNSVIPNANLLITDNTFGAALAVSENGQYMVVGVPGAKVSSSGINQGYAALYIRNINGYFEYSNVITSTVKVSGRVRDNEFFGYSVGIIGDKVIVGSKGSATIAPTVTAFYISKLIASALDISLTSFEANVSTPANFEVVLGTVLTDMTVANNGNVINSFSDGTVKVWNFSNTSAYNRLVQNISISNLSTDLKVSATSNFGKSITVSKDGTKLAIGVPEYSNTNPNEGAVIVYYNTPASFSQWAIEIPGLVPSSSSTTPAEISLGIKKFNIRRNGTGLVLSISTTFGIVKASPITIVTPGTGYLVGDVVVIVGGNNNATYQVTGVNQTTGAIIQGVLLTRGTGYSISAFSATTPKPLEILASQQVTITYDESNKMIGVVTEYDDATATLTVNVKEAYTPGTYTQTEFLVNPYNRPDEHFGSFVRFNTAGDQLAISSQGGSQNSYTVFDSDNTTFDLDATNFLEAEFGVGSVALYDYYDTKFIFSDSLDVGDAAGLHYGSAVAVSDKVYIGDFTATNGMFHEFSSPTKSWVKFREPDVSVNIEKIKSVFLYNIDENQVISYLDIVDPLQGKILGIAEKELSFKTYYDPATYGVGTEAVVVDPLTSWQAKNIGLLWWDLSSAKFIDPNQGSTLYKSNTWNNIFEDELVEVYEWVESTRLPLDWDALADTELGLTLGISGASKYGNNCYSISKVYDNVSKTFTTTYYFWVKNTIIVPDLDSRTISAKDVAGYISNPKNMGISYIALHASNQFSLVNCKSLVAGKKVAVNIRYWIIDNFEQSNIHSHYQLISNSNLDKPINKFIEQKWFDSLAGFDILGNEVPDLKVPVKLRYGIQSRPRQSMFVNRVEALKQFIERVNGVLAKTSIIDDFDFTALNSKDLAPNIGSGRYDYEIATYSQIRFVGTNEITRAVLTPIVENGKLVRVDIVNGGRGYMNPPNVVIGGPGSGASIVTVLDIHGQIISAIVEKSGAGYQSTATLTVRTLSVLVTADETSSNKWTLYSWDTVKKSWFREQTQTYDTTRYWKYIDWYLAGHNAFTRIDHAVEFAYQLPSKQVSIGEVVKVNNQGIGGWVLLEKIDNQDVLETTVNYKTIGRQNGTITFTDNLYKFAANAAGFDGPTFDSYVFDDQPKTELKIILSCIKNNIFIDNLSVEYKELFFASIRYAFSEQKFIDWAFKTSFVRSKHNLGALRQIPTYQNDNLASYQEYINEVKPYRSKIREFVSTYDSLELSHSSTTDFDLPPRYLRDENIVKTFETSISNGILKYDSTDIRKYPYSDWLYNVGFKITSIDIVDGGSGYTVAPQVIIEQAPSTITATAYISAGKVTKILLTDPFGENFLITPKILIEGSIVDGGTTAKAVAILSSSLVRSTKIGMKFDRVSATNTLLEITAVEKFAGSGSKTRFELAWPIDIIQNNTTVSDNSGEILGADYTVFNEIDTKFSYKRFKGILQFNTAPANLSTITIEYKKNILLLDAADRIKYFYKPLPGQLGSDLGQLMTGVDYGGVEVTGIGFDIGSGWDALPWFTTGYDQFDPNFTDTLIKSDGVTRSFYLTYAPTEIEFINVYWIGSRVTQTAIVVGSGTAGSTSLVVANINAIEKGQLVTGTGISAGTLVSSISGATVTLTKPLSVVASGSYIFTVTETFNKRIDDPNYSTVNPLLERLSELRNAKLLIENQLKTAQATKDTSAELELTLSNQATILLDKRAAAIANRADQEVIDTLLTQYNTAQLGATTALNAKEAAILVLTSTTKHITGFSGLRALTSVTISGLTGELTVPLDMPMTYFVGQSITVTGELGNGIIPGYVSGTTYFISRVLSDPDDSANNSTTIRITKTYDNAIKLNPVLDLQTIPNEVQAPSSGNFILKGTINTLQTVLTQLPSIVNVDAVMPSFIGDGTSMGTIDIPDSVALQTGDTIILRKNTSDGSFQPSDITYDTQLFGGDFSYRSATGIAAEDINVDGDGFVTPTNSHAPEEVVTGQVVDTVDITVYDKIADGAPIIQSVRYLLVNGVTEYAIGQRPGTSSAVIVKVNENVITQGINYTVNFASEKIELITAYAPDSDIVITSLSQNGLSILDLDYFTADGVTTEFISVARWASDVTVFVTVNGAAAEVTTFKTTSSYNLVGNIGIRFSEAPLANSIINYTVLAGAVDSISKVQKQTITYVSGDNSYELSVIPAFTNPLEDSTLVIVNGTVLRPPDTVYFIVSGNSRTYYVDTAKYNFNTIDSKVVTVSVNGVNIIQSIDYSWSPANNQLKLKKGVASPGDKISLSIALNADYAITKNGSGVFIEFSADYETNTTITLITFSNHDILEIERTNDTIKSASALTPGIRDYYNFNQLTGGRIKLRRPAIGSQYIWITLNRRLLTPNIDYALESGMSYVSFSSDIVFLETDVVDIIAFSNKVTRSSFGYKIFKDMLNKNSYTRIDDASSTSLAEPLNYFDSKITLDDASLLPMPSAALNKPGVLFINGERIEYFRKEGNIIRQIKRGTAGTGVKNLHAAGSLVRDQSIIQSIPYKDEYITNVTVSDGYNMASSIYVNSSTVSVDSIDYTGEDQTASPLGNDLVTVGGTGFKINARLFVGDVECSVTRTSETSLSFLTPAKIVGAYDLVIYNPAISAPTTATSESITGIVTLENAITIITTTSSILGKLRVGMLINRISGDGSIGSKTRITAINSPTVITIKSDTAITYGSLVFTGTEKVKTIAVTGTVASTDNALVSVVTVSGTYVDNTTGLSVSLTTNGFKVGMTLSRIDGLGKFGEGAIITEIVAPGPGTDPVTFMVTSITPNIAGDILFNVNNQLPTSYVKSAAIKYLKIPLNFAPSKSATDNWYRNTIPSMYGQCDDIEVFVAGRRLRKNPYTLWNPNASAAQVHSTDGDLTYEAEFSVAGSASATNLPTNPDIGNTVVINNISYTWDGSAWNATHIRLTEVLTAGQYIVIQKRLGRTWVPSGGSLAESGTESAKFIKATYALLPDKNKV